VKLVPGIFSGGKGGQCVGLTTLPTSCADCLEIWDPQPPGTLRPIMGLLYFLPSYMYLYSAFIIPAVDIYKCHEIQMSEHFSGKLRDPKASMRCCVLSVTLTGSCTGHRTVITYSRWKIKS